MVVSYMAKIYADLIRKEKKTLDEVPSKLKEQVEYLLKSIQLNVLEYIFTLWYQILGKFQILSNVRSVSY